MSLPATSVPPTGPQRERRPSLGKSLPRCLSANRHRNLQNESWLSDTALVVDYSFWVYGLCLEHCLKNRFGGGLTRQLPQLSSDSWW